MNQTFDVLCLLRTPSGSAGCVKSFASTERPQKALSGFSFLISAESLIDQSRQRNPELSEFRSGDRLSGSNPK
jgi:hypothetical protein